MKIALITGINGQDGSYLAELLLAKGYEVHGTVRSSSLEDNSKLLNIHQILEDVTLHPLNLEDSLGIYQIIKLVCPDECYHLGAQSFVNYSFTERESIFSINASSTLIFLQSILELCPDCRFYFAGSSEMFGEPDVSPQNERTRFNPKSLYGISKIASYHTVKNFREHKGLFACTGISYNHESPRRGHVFVTRKITSTLARIANGEDIILELGNLNSQRDWGWAPDYVRAMWLMLNKKNNPQDYILATGTNHTVQEFLQCAAKHVCVDLENRVTINAKFFRPTEEIPLLGNPAAIQRDLGWRRTLKFEEIIKEMMDNENLSCQRDMEWNGSVRE